MLLGIPKISVLVISYKQEHLIARAIDSLLAQKEYLYEICVSDDCSPDGTWTVLQQYSERYPGLFKLHQNQPNRGIFENIEYTWSMPKGDVIYCLSGDDECGEGWFQKVVDFILKNKIDYKQDLFCIYGDYKAVYPNGDSFVFSNKMISSGHDPLGLSLRKMICNRSACYSKNVLDRFIKVSDGRSYAVESAQDMQLQINSEKNYYIPFVGNVYYTRIGVCVGNNKNAAKENKAPMDYLDIVMKCNKYSLSPKDQKVFDYYSYRAKLRISKENCNISWYSFLMKKIYLFILFIQGIDFSLNLKANKIKRILFSIRRRLPHKDKLNWQL